MIEELEARVTAQLLKAGNESRAMETFEQQGLPIEVRARWRRDGGEIALTYSYGGVRLERAVLLLLLCPQTACERSRLAKSRWAARYQTKQALPRCVRTGPKTVDAGVGARLFDEVPVGPPQSSCVARPASFAVPTTCPVNAHRPIVVRMVGWDLFKSGEYVAGGLADSETAEGRIPKFASIEEVASWLRQTNE